MNHYEHPHVTASLTFYFKGERFNPSIDINLHDLMVKKQDISHIYDLLGASIGLDAYRHEYDVMVLEDITFSEPTGLAREFTCDGRLDFDAFALAWQQQMILEAVRPIARKHLGITDLEQHPDLCQALVDSYRRGQSTVAIKQAPQPGLF